MTSSADVRSQLVKALQLDLVGPNDDDTDYRYEILPQSPTSWYLTGFLAPSGGSLGGDDTANDQLDQITPHGEGDDNSNPEKTAARKGFFPVSMGLSFLVSQSTENIDITVDWGDYCPDPSEEDPENQPETGLQKPTNQPWQRTPQKRQLTITLSENQSQNEKIIPITDSNGLELVITTRPVNCHHLVPVGTRAISVFLVNKRTASPASERDLSFIFQACLTIHSSLGFVPRPNLKGQNTDDWDEKVADLQYQDDCEYVVGHNVSVVAFTDAEGNCNTIQTRWIPEAEVEKVIPREIQGVELGMKAIASAPDLPTLKAQIAGIVSAYTHWIALQKAKIPTNSPNRATVAQDLLNRAQIANERIEAGLNTLADPNAFLAFQIANRAIATALKQRKIHETDKNSQDLASYKWRPFQLAFILLNLRGIVDPTHIDRECVDLLFFPTGGGKTEAYLGLAAFTLVLRRLTHKGIQSAGVSVIMRYTLRLLTLDQLGRAATLICALELERQQNIEKLGKHPFEIGLWVGQSATPNVMGKKGDNNPNSARARTIAYNNDSRYKPSPIPLENCPWCGEKFKEKSFQLMPDADEPRNLSVICNNRQKPQDGQPQCVFRRNQFLPIVAVDDPIYRRLPCFLIATVDKFANLPWVGSTAGLFGKVNRYNVINGTDYEFYSSADKTQGQPLSDNLPPPDLIIQDELHLISGPLGTMVGLYETAIESLCYRKIDDKTIKPKIIASTATVRRAESQIKALFARNQVDIFPPPGIDRRDAFFAKTVPPTEKHPRLYLGIAAQGRSLKVILLRTYLALLGAAQKAWETEKGAKNPKNPADPYMTLLGYFNSLRELGGSRRIVEDEVNARLSKYSQRKRNNEAESLFSDRKIHDEPSELTSRESTNKVATTKRRLALSFTDKDHVDVALATNMISVGLDITRLGLMVVLGQPKTAAEYIQATSRVGRDENLPGLVVTLLNVHRPRDRSHYERFSFWHTTFYRSVEATSVTPFSPRAVDRGLAGITVALARLGHPQLTAPKQAAEIARYRQDLDDVVQTIVNRAINHAQYNHEEEALLRQTLSERVIDLLDSWQAIATDKGLLQYQQEVGEAPPLLFDFLDPELDKQPKIARKFKAGRSLRDVEPTVNLWVSHPNEEED